MSSLIWQKAPASPVLAVGEIHFWLASIDTVWSMIDLQELAESERTRLAMLKNEAVKKQFGVSAWLTRHLFSHYLQKPPLELLLRLSDEGKPFLDHLEYGVRSLEFNRSHSGGWIALAVCKDAAVGVDLECKKRPVEMQAIVERWFEAEERECFASLADNEKIVYFYDCWTRKEAVLKAWGVGISHLSEYAAYERKTWHKNFTVSPEFVACLAATTDPTRDVNIVSYGFG